MKDRKKEKKERKSELCTFAPKNKFICRLKETFLWILTLIQEKWTRKKFDYYLMYLLTNSFS